MPLILIVNDEPDLVEVCSVVLEGEGYAVRGLLEGSKVASVARELNPDLIILDWVIPDLHGTQVLRLLRQSETDHHIPVMMISALPDAEAQSQLAGADAFLAKPFDADQLADKVEATLRQARAKRSHNGARPNGGRTSPD
ncbi:MAG TPA: response regulator [Polyangia bacterium]|jgi:DNA-binding response OmpR family regulator|nr:response regulator [Polyangia bacterium]